MKEDEKSIFINLSARLAERDNEGQWTKLTKDFFKIIRVDS